MRRALICARKMLILVAETHPDYAKYDDNKAFHEAGYDSMLTAQVAIRLSTKLESAGSYLLDGSFAESEPSNDVRSDSPSPPDEGGGVMLDTDKGASESNGNNSRTQEALTVSSATDGLRNMFLAPIKALVGKGSPATIQDDALPADESDVGGNAINMEGTTSAGTVVATKTSAKKVKKKKKTKSKKGATVQSPAIHTGRFSHATAFDQLQELVNQDEAESEEERLQFDSLPSSTAYASVPVVTDTNGISEDATAPIDWDTPYWRREQGKAMPRFESDFWKVYGNRLRVFGTEEGLCQLC